MPELFPTTREYVRVVRKGSKNVRVELPNGETTLVPVGELISWTLIDGSNTSSEVSTSSSNVQEVVDTQTQAEPRQRRQRQSTQTSDRPKSVRGNAFHRPSGNDIGIDHPFTLVHNVFTSPVIRNDGTNSPF